MSSEEIEEKSAFEKWKDRTFNPKEPSPKDIEDIIHQSENKEKSAYDKWKERMFTPKKPSPKDIVHLSEKGRK